MTPAGLPHSAIDGSQDVCSYPSLFAAYHGLLRQTVPRHPPWTLIRLTIFFSCPMHAARESDAHPALGYKYASFTANTMHTNNAFASSIHFMPRMGILFYSISISILSKNFLYSFHEYRTPYPFQSKGFWR